MSEESKLKIEIASKVLAGLCANPALITDSHNSDFYDLRDRLLNSAWSYAGRLILKAKTMDGDLK